MVPSLNGDTTSMMSPPSGTASFLSNCSASSRFVLTEEVLQPPCCYRWISEAYFDTENFRLVAFVSICYISIHKAPKISIAAQSQDGHGLLF